MATISRLCYSTPAGGHHRRHSTPTTPFIPKFADNTLQNNTAFSLPSLQSSPNKPIIKPNFLPKLHIPCAATGGGDIGGGTGDGGSGGGSGSGGGGDSSDDKSSWDGFGPIGAFVNGWRSRVAADPQFPFKVLMEELVGVGASVLGDMASRPNFGLNELDFVFSTLVVGSILNFVLMYLLAPTMSSPSTATQSLFGDSLASHMFEPGPYSLLSRFGTLVYKGTLFAIVGFGAGLVGTAISNGLITMRKKMDPNFETPNKAPPTLLNATTWAVHMGVSANLRYQTLNGIEYLLEKGLPPLMFKTSVLVLRCLNNVLGGMSFVMLARLTGSQSSGISAVEEEEKGADGESASSAK